MQPALDDRRHAPASATWCERWELVWGDLDAGLGGVIELVLRPAAGLVWFTSLLARRPGAPVVVVSTDLTVPPGPSSLEVRGDGLWADLVVEEPLVHMSCNLEAFGVEVDTFDGVDAEVRGVLVPYGYELDFVTAATAPGSSVVDPTEIPCRVEGVVLLGADTVAVDGTGWRRHRWGEGPDSAPAGVAHLVDVLRDVVAGRLDLL